NDTPLTARTTFFFRWKCVWRSWTSSSGAVADALICLTGGHDMAPRPRALGRAPAEPWRAPTWPLDGSSAELRIEGVAQTVADDVEGHRDEDQHDARHRRHVRRYQEEVASVRTHDPPV